MPLKADADEILAHMKQLPSTLRLDGNRRWWPRWIYRSDHVENAADILNSGQLLSREAAENESVIRVDSGSPQHVGQLTNKHRSLVRLYFRPRTPTQYANEGIRPRSRIQYGAHMPVPVYLLFAASLLAEQGVYFTKGRLTQEAAVGDSAEFLKSIDFGDVYHDGGVGRLGEHGRRPVILNARHTEVVVKNELSLDKLKHIVCRSAAERETLLNLLGPEARARWLERIHVDEGHRIMFEKRGTFIKKAELSSAESAFLFYLNDASDMRGPFELTVEWTIDGRTVRERKDGFVVSKQPVAYSISRPVPRYQVRVRLDGNLAYLGDFDERDEPDSVI
ncbi:MAG: DarT ssDNA thymidine ADP-ribosyltransferase family protein [Gammaproteobacteria bacterium]|nr:DarT ssDNA thymidine ADP-ribosyltransferase family protein [Gammaproteobacteria bacterium]